MPIYLSPACLIIDKKAIAQKYVGVVSKFCSDYFSKENEFSQENDEIFMIAPMNSDEYDIDELIQLGLDYDKEIGFSNDFVIYQRYYGYLWQVDWMEDNKFYAWHIDTNPKLKSKAGKFGEIKMNRLEKIYNAGLEPFLPLTNENHNTHPMSSLLDEDEN